MLTRRHAVFILNYVAGWIDAVGFLALVGSVQAFPSFMSGNSTKVVTDLVSGHFSPARLIGGVVLIFIAGTIVTRLINDGSRRRETAALAIVAVVLAAATAGAGLAWNGYVVLLLLACGMGMINRAIQGSNGLTVHTFVSGAVVTIGSDIADALSGRGSWKQILLPLGIWVTILFGAACGGLLTVEVGPVVALGVPAGLVALLALADGAGRLESASKPKDGHTDAIEAHG